MSNVQLLTGDCRDVLPTLPERSVQCVITSPPYFGLRDYGTAEWEGGDTECDHETARVKTRFDYDLSNKQRSNNGSDVKQYGQTCTCGARRIDHQIGLEALHDCLAWARQEPPCADCYVCALRGVFALLWKVLRDDGCVFLNLGDSYAGSGKGGNPEGSPYVGFVGNKLREASAKTGRQNIAPGLKPKDLIGVPWRVALALQADGWWLRSDTIWSKPNPMPESVTDRPTRSHEYVFLLAKSERYSWDQEAVREPNSEQTRWTYPQPDKAARAGVTSNGTGASSLRVENPNGRNIRSVWTIATAPYADAHFATFPPALAERCLLAGTSPQACEHCHAPWARVVERTASWKGPRPNGDLRERNIGGRTDGFTRPPHHYTAQVTTTGWRPTCACVNDGTGRCTVLDPFAGSGTVSLVAIRHQRNAIGIDLNPEYAELQQKRTNGVQITMTEVTG